MALILAAWAVLGFLLAVPLLRRAARRESGSRLSERHRKAGLSGSRGREGVAWPRIAATGLAWSGAVRPGAAARGAVA